MNSVSQSSAKLRALIVDDEPPARSNLATLLKKDNDIEIIGECGTGMEAVQQIRSDRPDIVFLDVQMPECDGFDVLELLGAKAPPVIVFVTAYDEYAVRAFEAGALDYIIKPFDNERFYLALRRAKDRIAQTKSAPRKIERLPIKSSGQVLFVNISDIDWIEAADYYACLHARGRNHLLRRSIADLEQELRQDAFCRIHRSTIVNLERIQSLAVNENGNYEVVLKDGTRLRLSESHRRNLQVRLEVRK